jgi:hypothetical protein
MIPSHDPDILRAVSGLVEGRPLLAMRWLAGDTLTDRERAVTSLPISLSDETSLADVIVTIASLHRATGRPFMFVLDELEHLVRFDKAHNSKRNTTWLKRLVEKLSTCGALVCVSGHTDAWTEQRDFVDRFSKGLLVLETLKAPDVMGLVSTFVEPRTFTLDTAALVAERAITIRQVLALLGELFRLSEGFSRAISADDINQAAVRLGHGMDADTALQELARLCENRGFRVQFDASASPGISNFDLVAFRGTTPMVVVDVTHATYRLKQHDQVRHFIDKMRALAPFAPECLGCFLAEGVLDDQLAATLQSAMVGIAWLDLASGEVGRRFEELLGSQLDYIAHSERERGSLDGMQERSAALA